LTFMMNTKNEPGLNLWQSSLNPDLTLRERIRRKIELHEQAIRYAYPVWRQASRLEHLKQLILKNNLHDSTIEKKFIKINKI